LQLTNTAGGGAVQGKIAAAQTLPALLTSDLTGLIVRRPRWWKPWAATGAEVIMQSGPTLGRLLQPFGPPRADIAEAFMPCPAWQWGEHHAGDVTREVAPLPTPTADGLAPPILPEPSPFDPGESPASDPEPSPFDDPEPEDFEWIKE